MIIYLVISLELRLVFIDLARFVDMDLNHWLQLIFFFFYSLISFILFHLYWFSLFHRNSILLFAGVWGTYLVMFPCKIFSHFTATLANTCQALPCLSADWKSFGKFPDNIFTCNGMSQKATFGNYFRTKSTFVQSDLFVRVHWSSFATLLIKKYSPSQ
jgi:hypothetical protein